MGRGAHLEKELTPMPRLPLAMLCRASPLISRAVHAFLALPCQPAWMPLLLQDAPSRIYARVLELLGTQPTAAVAAAA